MASDGRYLYHPPPGSQPMPQYEYPSYPASDYDSAQMPQQPPRPMRHAQPPHPHAQPSYPPQPAPSPYQTPYGAPPANYPAPPHPQHQHHPPPVQPQWAGEGWPQYQQPQQFASAPPPVQQDPSFASGPGRPDAAPNTSPDARAYPPPAPPARNVRSAGSTPQPQGKPRGRESSQPTSRMPPTQAGFDFHKLLESYRLVIHESQVLSAEPLPAQTRSPPQETVERMWQSAQYGLQMLEATLHQATVQSSPAEPSPPIERPPTGAPEMPREGPPAPGVVPKPRDAPVAEGQMCLGCNATSTPEWRRGPMGPRTLCNACGLVYAKLIKKRTREAARGRGGGSGRGRAGGQHGFGEDAGGGSDGEGGSEDDDSFGSQDRQSDAGVGRE